MRSRDNKDGQRDTFQDFSMEVSREVSRDRVESLWKQTMAQKSSGRADLAAARANRAKAEMERHRISNQALEATREACRELIAESERQLARAKNADAEAEKRRGEAENEWQRAQTAKSEADSYCANVMAEAQQEAERMKEEARSAALQECEELKRHVTYEVQCILSEIDTIRSAAQEELEAQRIYAEAATIKAMSRDVQSQVMGSVDRALYDGSGQDVDGPYIEPMAEPTNGTTDGQHQEPMPVDQMESVGAPSKRSKNGKGSSRASS